MPTGVAPLLVCSGVEVRFGQHQVLHGVDLTVGRGEVVALVGRNGSGKSTLLNAISQLVTPSAGTIELEGVDITRAGALQVARLGISQVPGGRGMFPTLTVAEHFTASSWLCRDRVEAAVRIEAVLEMLPRVRGWWDRRAGELSKGEQQQVALAVTMIASPSLLLIDELSLGLAPAFVDEALDLVQVVNLAGCGVLVVEQSLEVAQRVASRAYFLERGAVRFSGPTTDLADRHELRNPVLIPTTPRALPGLSLASLTPSFPPSSPPIAALTVHDVTKRFGGVEAVSEVSLEVPDGAIVGLIGPNGAGKTTLIDLIAGVHQPDRGAIALRGTDLRGLAAHERARLGLGRSSPDARLFPSLTVTETIALAFECRLEVRDHVASTLGLAAARSMERDLASRVEELVVLLGLQPVRDGQIESLSTGTRRVVELAMAMAQRPSVLLLDEPSAGLAQAEVEALPSLLLRLRDETGCSMVVIDHDLALIRAIADVLVVLAAGRVIAQGEPGTVERAPAVVAAYFGAPAGGRPPRRRRRHPLRAAR